MTGLIQDIRYALRALKRAPGFAAVSIVTLALGIAATTIVYSIVDGILLRPLPIADPDRVMLAREALDGGDMSFSVAELSRFPRAANLVRAVRGVARADGQPDRHRRAAPPQRQARDLGPALGARRESRCSAATSPPTTTSSASSARRSSATRSGSASSAARRRRSAARSMLDESPVTVIGVLPPDFTVAREEECSCRSERITIRRTGCTPVAAITSASRRSRASSRASHPETANAEMVAIARQLEQEYPNTNSGNSAIGKAAVRNAGRHRAANALRAVRRGPDDAADRVRQPRQPDAVARRRTHAGNGGAPIARRRALAHRAADADREPVAGDLRRHRRRRAGLRRLRGAGRAAAAEPAAHPHHLDRSARAVDGRGRIDRHRHPVRLDAGHPGGDRKIDDAAAQLAGDRHGERRRRHAAHADARRGRARTRAGHRRGLDAADDEQSRGDRHRLRRTSRS